MSTKTKKNKNIFAAYFKPFGLRQICDLLIFASAVVIIVGLCTLDAVAAVGFGLFAAACLLAIFRAVKTMAKKGVNKRSAEYKNAMINAIIMCVLLALAVLGILYSTVLNINA